jgi:hypothetical protein
MAASRQAVNAYTQVFAFNARIKAFLDDLGERRGWRLIANLHEASFTVTFIAFLDAPNPARAKAVLAFEADIASLDSRFKDVRPGYRATSAGHGCSALFNRFQ